MMSFSAFAVLITVLESLKNEVNTTGMFFKALTKAFSPMGAVYLRHKATAVSEGFAAVHTVAEQGSDTVAVVAEQAADTEAVPVHLPAEPVLERLLTFRSCKQHCLQAVLRNIYRISW